jgi:Arc/MetJ-type ribon-helix-helix transcriptional regulator
LGSKTRKVTFSLSEDVLAALDEAVAQGNAPSKSAFVKQALLRELRELARQHRQRRWEEAARDPLFMRDVAEIGSAFESADAESLSRPPG